MTSNQLKHQAKLQEWARAIQECRNSGMSVKEWCGNRGITTTTCFRWDRHLLALAGVLRGMAQKFATSTSFAELPAPREQCRTVAQQAAAVHINDVAIDSNQGMDAELLKMLMEAMRPKV